MCFFLCFLLFGELCYPTNCRKWRKRLKWEKWWILRKNIDISPCFIMFPMLGGKNAFFREITTKLRETNTQKKQETTTKMRATKITANKKHVWKNNGKHKINDNENDKKKNLTDKNWQDNNLKHTQCMAAQSSSKSSQSFLFNWAAYALVAHEQQVLLGSHVPQHVVKGQGLLPWLAMAAEFHGGKGWSNGKGKVGYPWKIDPDLGHLKPCTYIVYHVNRMVKCSTGRWVYISKSHAIVSQPFSAIPSHQLLEWRQTPQNKTIHRSRGLSKNFVSSLARGEFS